MCAGEPVTDKFSFEAPLGMYRYVLGVRGYGTVLGVDCFNKRGVSIVGVIALEPTTVLMVNQQKFSANVDPMTMRLFKNIKPRIRSASTVGHEVAVSRAQREAQHAALQQHANDERGRTFRCEFELGLLHSRAYVKEIRVRVTSRCAVCRCTLRRCHDSCALCTRMKADGYTV